MGKKNISQEKIVQSFLTSAFEKSAGATSLSDIADCLEIKKASLYNHFESREAMYAATIEACGTEFSQISFLTEKTLEGVTGGKTSMTACLKKLVTRYFNLYEAEPLFQMYVFVHAEQYFNLAALEIIRKENERLADEIKQLLQGLMEAEKCKRLTEKETKELAGAAAAIILQQLDFYIANRKEIVRQNPESGAGSLFALPTDDIAVNKAVRTVEALVRGFCI